METNKELIDQLREYAGNAGYSHQDYADTMRLAAAALSQRSEAVPVDDYEAFATWKGYPLPALNSDGQFPDDWMHREYRAYQAGRRNSIAPSAAAGEQVLLGSIFTGWAIYYDNLGVEPYASAWVHPFKLYESEEEARTHFVVSRPQHYIPKKVSVSLAQPTPAQGDAVPVGDPDCNYAMPAGRVGNKCGRIHRGNGGKHA